MDLARKLIDTLAGDWTPEKYLHYSIT